MSKFHSIVSRRQFMKGLGLTGAGIGAAALTAPMFHDLDEVSPVILPPRNCLGISNSAIMKTRQLKLTIL